jgi:DUF1365 family protein
MTAESLRRIAAPAAAASATTARAVGEAAAAAHAACGPAVIEGRIVHRRRRPAPHAFDYPAFCLRLPLSRLAELPGLGIARNARGVLSFHDRDHGACDGTALLPWIRGLLAAEGVAADGEVMLYAFPRMLGYVFNPVSFWVCHDAGGAVRAVLCEVRNTFGERHNYLLAHPDGRALASGVTLAARKVFHVSPFCAVEGRYEFRFGFAADRWLARIDYFDGADPVSPLLETSISGAATPLTPAVARALPWRHRLYTAGVVARIHWQALRLWAKRVPYFRKPPPPREETTR